MKRLLAGFSLLALIVAGSGCCHHLCGGGGGCPPSPCGPYGSTYGGNIQPAYASAAIPVTGFTTVSTAACDCAPAVSPY